MRTLKTNGNAQFNGKAQQEQARMNTDNFRFQHKFDSTMKLILDEDDPSTGQVPSEQVDFVMYFSIAVQKEIVKEVRTLPQHGFMVSRLNHFLHYHQFKMNFQNCWIGCPNWRGQFRTFAQVQLTVRNLGSLMSFWCCANHIPV